MAKKNQTTIKAEPCKQEIIITREFDAPRDLVFKAFTDPKLIVQWLGPKELTMKVEKFESRNGDPIDIFIPTRAEMRSVFMAYVMK